jgi:catechol 2,3-dioxygenase-like lactoylglutathione lyase family enzyme
MDGIQDLITGLRHVGFITTDLKASIASFRHVYALRDDQIQVIPPFGEPCETRFAFIQVADAHFELIEPVSDYFKSILLSDRPGINHVAWTVRDLDAAVERMAKRGIRPGHVTPNGIVELPQQKLVYFDPRDTGGMLIELVEPKQSA